MKIKTNKIFLTDLYPQYLQYIYFKNKIIQQTIP